MADHWQQWIEPVVALAKLAGDSALKYFKLSSEQMNVGYKQDHTYITNADLEAHHILQQGLQKLTPMWPILSEEGVISPWELRRHWLRYWLLDPIDGTRGFVEQCEEFTVNVALIDQRQAVLGVVYAPALKLCYYAARGCGVFKQVDKQIPEAIHSAAMNWHAFKILFGRYLHSPRMPELFKQVPGCEVVSLNSSLKFCWIAEGKGDVYPRFGDTSEWDTAAAQCVLEQAGGAVVDLEGKALQYNAKESLINPAFIAIGDPKQQNKIIELVKQKRSEK
jgi:3'(2'), 5'-bisphosphate nucleotidase